MKIALLLLINEHKITSYVRKILFILFRSLNIGKQRFVRRMYFKETINKR